MSHLLEDAIPAATLGGLQHSYFDKGTGTSLAA